MSYLSDTDTLSLYKYPGIIYIYQSQFTTGGTTSAERSLSPQLALHENSSWSCFSPVSSSTGFSSPNETRSGLCSGFGYQTGSGCLNNIHIVYVYNITQATAWQFRFPPDTSSPTCNMGQA
eukprot:TRINITY_DN5991_c0_g4_i1.p1 TRINITY_DN5991_c0_g4~~TRINITY_DN5991_c0_g4_i1.p1  ORF type:complete len:121 (+),score=2.98 TRINITY_DN5991_c0_g4_i1:701-1063(+)